jgi:hypothetical protein
MPTTPLNLSFSRIGCHSPYNFIALLSPSLAKQWSRHKGYRLVGSYDLNFQIGVFRFGLFLDVGCPLLSDGSLRDTDTDTNTDTI